MQTIEERTKARELEARERMERDNAARRELLVRQILEYRARREGDVSDEARAQLNAMDLRELGDLHVVERDT